MPASSAPAVLADLVEADKAESVIVIPGGFEEKAGTEAITARMSSALERARAPPLRERRQGRGGGPIIVGGNCLGILSVPGRYNTLFIPEHKLPRRAGAPDPVALVSQSGAFAITRLSKHPRLAPEYVITCGNQMDATVGDFLEYLAEDESIRVFAVYIEGFKPLDGEKVLRACDRITSSCRTVIVYRAGRSAAGAAASASHTASIAGDYPVTRALFAQAGADSRREPRRVRRRPGGLHAAARQGARGQAARRPLQRGLRVRRRGRQPRRPWSSHPLSPETRAGSPRLSRRRASASIVDVHNPLDLTPMADDEAYEECFRAILEDPGVDCGLAGIVPLTAALHSLDSGPDYAGDLGREDGLAARYGRLMAQTSKPWVAVVDSGPLFDPLARALESRGDPDLQERRPRPRGPPPLGRPAG